MTSSSITVQWEEVDCIHRNGNITGYIVQFRVQGSEYTQRKNVAGAASTKVTLTGLAENSIYCIEVAAVNSEGTGEYSIFTTGRTSGKNN